MIAVLQRQHVNKRTIPPVAQRARSTGVRWSNREVKDLRRQPPLRLDLGIPTAKIAARVRPRPPEGHRFLQRQFVDGRRRREARTARRQILREAQRSAARRVPDLGPRGSGAIRSAVARAARSPWLFIALAAAAACAFALTSLNVTGLALMPSSRPALPAPAEADPALYGLLVPEQTARPAGGSPVSLASLKVTAYTTRAGDSLSKIAARFRLNVDTVVSWNDIRDGRTIAQGTTLNIPNSDGLKYTVRRGDTLQGIARKWGVDFNAVLDWNRLASSVIPVGQELFLPGARMNPNELNRILGSLFMHPVQGRISSFFGERADPFTGVPNYHNGVDIVNKPGTSILAAMAGTVADVGFNYNYGNYVILKHSGQYQTLYGHLTRSIVSRGQKIGQAQKIGELGSTGYSTGPHLHFSIFRNGQPVDPLRFLK